MKRWQKIAVIIFALIAAVPVIAVLYLIAILPDPATIGESIRSRTARPTPTVSAQITASPKANSGTRAITVPKPTSTIIPVQPIADTKERNRLVTEAFVDRYLSDDRIQSRVCDNLQASPPPFSSVKEFEEQIEKSLLKESPPSATAEAIMLPVEYTLKNEAVRELVELAREAADRGNTGFIKKAQFYALATRATASLLNTREELEAISDSAYRLYAISRATALKPEILQDPDLSDLCRGLERSAIDGISRDDAYDRDRLGRLLLRHGISNEAIGYDPNETTQIRLVQDGGSFEIKLPWFERVFKK
jgi:hypothetical protein